MLHLISKKMINVSAKIFLYIKFILRCIALKFCYNVVRRKKCCVYEECYENL